MPWTTKERLPTAPTATTTATAATTPLAIPHHTERRILYLIQAPLSVLTKGSTLDICLHRFLQEALTNATRHDHASEIAVRLQSNARKILLSVQDNGRGFDPKAVLFNHARPPGIGLIGMQERLKMVGGWLEIESEPGRGTKLVAHVEMV